MLLPLRPQLGALVSSEVDGGHRCCPSQRGTSCCHGNQRQRGVSHENKAVTLPFSSHGVLERPRVVAPEAQGMASLAIGSYPHPAPPEMSERRLKAFCALLDRADVPCAWACEPHSLAALICRTAARETAGRAYGFYSHAVCRALRSRLSASSLSPQQPQLFSPPFD